MPPSLKAFQRKHQQWTECNKKWSLLDRICSNNITDDIKRELLVNPDGRPKAVVDERVKCSTFVNVIAPVLTRLNGHLFSSAPKFEGSKKEWVDEFMRLGGRKNSDDDSRCSFLSFLEYSHYHAMTTGKAIAQVDTGISQSLIDQLVSQGLLNPNDLGDQSTRVMFLERTGMWDWSVRPDGEFAYVKLHRFRVVRGSWDQPPIAEHDFTIYERDGERVLVSRYLLRKRKKANEPPPPPGAKDPDPVPFIDDVSLRPEDVDAITVLERQPVFNFAGKFKFPVLTLTLPSNLCLARQLYDLQAEHYNLRAGIRWKFQTTNFEMPVITGGSRDDSPPLDNKKMGDGFYLWLPEGYNLTSMNLGGGTIQGAASFLETTKKDVYDALQQIAASAEGGAAAIARSGESKKEDRRLEQKFLRSFGAPLQDFAKEILEVASLAEGEEVEWKVDGWKDFISDKGLLEDLADFEGARRLAVPSPSFNRQIFRDIASEYAKGFDIDQEVLQKILTEIDALPDDKLLPPDPPPPGQEPGGVPTGSQSVA